MSLDKSGKLVRGRFAERKPIGEDPSGRSVPRESLRFQRPTDWRQTGLQPLIVRVGSQSVSEAQYFSLKAASIQVRRFNCGCGENCAFAEGNCGIQMQLTDGLRWNRAPVARELQDLLPNSQYIRLNGIEEKLPKSKEIT